MISNERTEVTKIVYCSVKLLFLFIKLTMFMHACIIQNSLENNATLTEDVLQANAKSFDNFLNSQSRIVLWCLQNCYYFVFYSFYHVYISFVMKIQWILNAYSSKYDEATLTKIAVTKKVFIQTN